MRTEDDLREAMTALADTAPEIAAARARLQLSAQPVPELSPRRRAPGLAVAVVLLAGLAVVLPRWTDRAGMPADPPTPGNWNMIFRVDPPPGLEVTRRANYGFVQLVELSGRSGAQWADCSVLAYAPGAMQDLPSVADRGGPAAINGRQGFTVPPGPATVQSQVFWPYREDAWAIAVCQGVDREQRALEVARAVRFRPEPLEVPFRLASLPPGYAVDGVESTTSGKGGPEATVGLIRPDAVPKRQSIFVSLEPRAKDVPPQSPRERGTVAGYPAVFETDQSALVLLVGRFTVRFATAKEYPQEPNLAPQPTDPSTPPWPPGRRALLVAIAEDLELADDLGDPSTWFPANRAFPR